MNHPITIIMVQNDPVASLYVESAVVTAGESSWGDGFYVGYHVQSTLKPSLALAVCAVLH